MENLTELHLQNISGLETIEFSDHDDWLSKRTGGIGGSDTGAIMGISKYSSPLSIYKAKVEGISNGADNKYTRKGTDLEPVIREKYVRPFLEEAGYKVYHPECMFVNPVYPWLRANIDGLAVKKDGTNSYSNIIIEIKTVSEFAESEWNLDGTGEYHGIPAGYYAQVHHYMTVLQAKYAVVCALFDSDWTVHYFKIPYDKEFARKMLTATAKFWSTNVLLKIPPDIKPSMDTAELLESLDKPIEVKHSNEFDILVEKYINLDEMNKAAAKEQDKIKDEVLSMYLKGYRCSDESKLSVSVSKLTRSGFDSKKFACDHPDMYSNYKTESTYSKPSFRRKK